MRELCGNGVGRDRHIGGLIAYGNERLIGVRGMPGLDRRKVRELDNAHGLMREFTSQWAISFPTQKPLAAKRRDRKSVVYGKSVSVRIILGGRSIITKKELHN